MSRTILHFFVEIVGIALAIVGMLVLSSERLLLLLFAAFLVAAEDGNENGNGDSNANQDSEENVLFHPVPECFEVSQSKPNISLEVLVGDVRTTLRVSDDDIELGLEQVQIFWRSPGV